MSMMRSKMLLTLMATWVALAAVTTTAWPAEVPRMTKEELRPLLGNSDLIVLDVRTGRQWKDSKEKIAGAVREDPTAEIASWVAKYPKEKTIVLYCT